MLALWREEERIFFAKTFIIYQLAFFVDFNSRL